MFFFNIEKQHIPVENTRIKTTMEVHSRILSSQNLLASCQMWEGPAPIAERSKALPYLNTIPRYESGSRGVHWPGSNPKCGM